MISNRHDPSGALRRPVGAQPPDSLGAVREALRASVELILVLVLIPVSRNLDTSTSTNTETNANANECW